jgi:ribose-phosphate pyrophosphokinase
MMKLFSGTANKKLAEEIAKEMHVKLAKAEVIRFGNSEIKVFIQESVKDKECFIVQPTSNPTDTHLMELFFFADALKRGEAKKIVGIIPYFGYARQNREHRPGEAVSVNVVIKFLETVGFNEIYTIDLHDEGTEGIFSIPFKNISALPYLFKKIKKDYDKDGEIVIASPDQGGVERARLVASKNSEIVVIEKKRNLDAIHQAKAISLFGDVAGKIVVLVDDIITSGRTIVSAAELCLKHGAKKTIAAITHHDFTPEAPQFLQSSCLEKIYSTNSIELRPEQKIPKLKEFSIAKLIVENIQ